MLPRALRSQARAVRLAATLPKDETRVSDLRESVPHADGRGVVCAVLDTGCDLNAAGLATTSHGLPKYVDFLDCTGGGDVDVTRVEQRRGDHVASAAGGDLRPAAVTIFESF